MDIRDLPNGLKELAIVRHLEENNKATYYSEDILNMSFYWKDTKEGEKFWNKINTGDNRPYYDLYPEHEWALDYPGEYQVIADAFGNTIVAKVGDYVCPPFDTAYSIGTKLHEDVDISSLTITPAVLANGYYAGEGVSQEIKDAWKHGYEYANRLFGEDGPQPFNDEGIKDEDGKISYELDWEFIESMAARMSKNKGKYPPYNWKKFIKLDQLKQSLIRHVVEIMKGNYNDDEDELGHIIAVSCNAQMLFYRLNNYKD